MHKTVSNPVAAKAVKAMEEQFLTSAQGKQYLAAYKQIDQELSAAEAKMDDFWTKATHDFETYITSMGY